MREKSKLKSKGTDKHLVNEVKNQLARALADYDNLRKRAEAEIDDKVRLAKARLVLKLVAVFDMLEEAQGHLKDNGLAITIKEFEEIFTQEGLEKIDAEKGMEFDEEIHEAVEVLNLPAGGKGKDGEIAGEILGGWKFIEGPVIRASKVRVYQE